MLVDQAHAQGMSVYLLTNKSDTARHDASKADIHRVFQHTIYEHWNTRDIWRDAASREKALALRERAKALTEIPPLASNAADMEIVSHYLRRARNLLAKGYVARLNKKAISKYGRGKPILYDLFADRLGTALKSIEVSSGDVIVIHTATFGMLESLPTLRVSMDLDAPIDVDCHCIFHHSPTDSGTEYWFNRYYQVSEPRRLRQRLTTGSPFRRLRFSATNEPLRQQLTKMLGARVDSFHDIVDPGTELSDRSIVSKTSVDVGVRAADVTDDNLAAISACLAQIAARHPDVRIHVLASSDLPSSTTALSLMSLRCVASVRTTQSREEYFRAIDSLDVLLLPYREAHYGRRVSGVFFDCTSRGVTVVVAEGTTMALAYSPLVFTYYSEAMMASALDLAVGSARSSALTKLRWDVAQSVRAIAKRDVVAELTGAADAPSVEIAEFGPIATIVQPAWGRCGSSTVFDSENEYLLSRGFFVIRLLVAQWEVGLEHAKIIYDLVEENATRVKPHAFALMSLTRASEQRARAQSHFATLSAFGQQNELLGASEHDNEALIRFAYEKSDLAVVNHSFHSKIAQNFRKARKVLETQDVQAVQFGIRGETNKVTKKPERLRDWLGDEAKVWREFDACVNLSEDENVFIGRHAKKSYYIRPYIIPRSLSVQRSWRQFVSANGLHESFLNVDRFDMMLWGDLHPANIESTQWFLREIATPHFGGLPMAIVGRVGGLMYDTFGSRAGFYYGGFLDSLDDCFARARVLVLPDKRGTGMSIKTLETLALGRPFAATDFAMRGVDLSGTGYRPATSAEELRADIAELLHNPRAMSDRAQLSKQLYRMNFSPEVYNERWDRVLSDLGMNIRPPSAPEKRISRPDRVALELQAALAPPRPQPKVAEPVVERHVTLKEFDHLPDNEFVDALLGKLIPGERDESLRWTFVQNVKSGIWSHHEAALQLATSMQVLDAGILVDDLDELSTEPRKYEVDLAGYVELSPDDQIRKAYREILLKEADPAGLGHYLYKMSEGEMNLVSMVQDIASVSEAPVGRVTLLNVPEANSQRAGRGSEQGLEPA
jgi:glycosyltransferase involved in cell wall biosynthesis